MSNKKTNRSRIFLAAVIAATTLASAYGVGSYLSSFESTYSAAVGSSIDTCTLCHTSSSGGSRNSYGSAYASNGYSFKAIESLDSDGDGFTNLAEIKALTFPGSASSKPAGDTTAPTVTAFSIPATSTSLTVSITTLTATDSVGVTGYLVNESSTKPSATAGGWSASKPASYTFGSEGSKTLYAWAKDAANNVSSSLSASTTITLPPAPDTTAPTVTAFAIPATSSSYTVSITTLTATDNIGVTGYFVNESSTKPSASAGGWSASKPASYTFGSEGSKTLYAWAKDAANNISSSLSAATTITLPPTGDTTAPTITAFTIPATATSLAVSVTSLVASDNVGITGYLLTESSTKPVAGTAGWTNASPSSYTFGSEGAKTLYAWAKDAAGNVSNSRSASTTITISPAADTIAPTITTFAIPPASTSLTVGITSFSASDNVATTGYLVTESSTKPGVDAAGWKSSAPTSYTFGASGAKVLYGWAKDAAGNVSNSKSAATTVTSTDSTAPDMSVWVGTWFKVRINRDAGKEDWKASDGDGDDSKDDGSEKSEDSGEITYLKVNGWDAATQTLQASIYYQNDKKGPWISTPLPFHFTSGDCSRFLFWFEYAGEYQFAAGMIAKVNGDEILKARFNAAGIYLYKSEDEMDVDVNLALTIVANMVPENSVPYDAQAAASAQAN
jgi:hypothetical protein